MSPQASSVFQIDFFKNYVLKMLKPRSIEIIVSIQIEISNHCFD